MRFAGFGIAVVVVRLFGIREGGEDSLGVRDCG